MNKCNKSSKRILDCTTPIASMSKYIVNKLFLLKFIKLSKRLILAVLFVTVVFEFFQIRYFIDFCTDKANIDLQRIGVPKLLKNMGLVAIEVIL